MTSLIVVLTALGTVLSSPIEIPSRDVELTYRRPLGQVAEYELSLQAQGQQISLGERLPVRWRAELEFTEEVIAQGRDGVLWLRVSSRPLKVEDAAGTLGTTLDGRWPEVQVRVTPRGEVLDVSVAAGEARPGVRGRALLSLMAQPAPIILPAGPVAAGAAWEWERGGMQQTNRLVGIDGEDDWQLARISSVGSAPLELQERSEELGLTTRLEGQVTHESQLDLLVARGVAARHKGKMHAQTESEVSLALPEGEKAFRMRSDLLIDFELRLVSIDGKPVKVPGG